MRPTSYPLLQIVLGFVVALSLDACAASNVDHRFREGMSQIDAYCQKHKIGPYLDPKDPQYREKTNQTDCDILKLPMWTELVQTEGQPEPVPAQWLATPEGKFAHSIKIPNPVPKDSGYKSGMSGEQYFKHLCEKEAGEFIYKTADNIDGFYFMRPPKRPTDYELQHLYALEAPEIERTFQLRKALPAERGKIFINPPWSVYSYIEEPRMNSGEKNSYVRVFGYRQNVSSMLAESTNELKSRYGLTWRGLKRPNDRELGISGGEWIVIDLKTNDVLAVIRNYGRTGGTPNVRGGIWWLNAVSCSQFAKKYKYPTSEKIYTFTSNVLRPISGEPK